MIAILEDALGVKAVRRLEDMQAGDVKETYADITAIGRDYGFAPTTPLSVGLPKFVEWYRRNWEQRS
jgi:UDP-glucuronate 4-epimerase